MQILKLILFILLVILIVTFILQNQWIIQQEYSIKYTLYETPPISLYVILLFVFFLGALLSSLCYLVRNSKLKRFINQQKKKIKQMEQELISLRNLPIIENQDKETSFQKN